jgi:rhamnose utilization protein RhaD (predicted bifunctional aldolase and dehydrogenase)
MIEMPHKDLEELSAYCAHIGRDPLLVQGPGGNVSSKDGEVLWVKASGTWLAEAEAKNIFVPVDLQALRADIAEGNFSASPQTLGETVLRPSIETLLHALMPHKFVVHLHAIEPLAHLVRKDVHDTLPRLMDTKKGWAFVDYFKPGADLARAIFFAMERVPNIEVVFMVSHGIVIGADSIAGIDKILKRLIRFTATTALVEDDAPAPLAMGELERLGYYPCTDGGVNQLAQDRGLLNRVINDWALYPDHLVFLGERPVILGDILTVHNLSRLEKLPSYLFAPEVGVYEHLVATPAHRAQIRCYFDVLSRQSDTQQLSTLNSTQIDEIINWDAERYRQVQNLK